MYKHFTFVVFQFLFTKWQFYKKTSILRSNFNRPFVS
jgi:hypothetical protein